ncbi:4-amino-4-deoxy-L-arabinose transferase [Curtobacterium sp. MCJR17_055]|uniref:YrdB family protein n=1 Tax=unclassified Curtobacterium TaxID=257496 RepID=UPI000D8FA41D|nr:MULTISPECIES: YrdB family protein [unclassified Curtobacterium]PYY37581.1 4-amino-4-deoxy-L-arabinose transferase [Curtobacterium sp. MCBD17_029]PYY56237.1 4-amino-4-deoxy-L-arabinose transferase [Curtobacterium sp. MCPF17_015]PYY56608.1 4-amino-4-deoxy-L-arabinose transferase [Curtobacterium sp. MCJR17_055]
MRDAPRSPVDPGDDPVPAPAPTPHPPVDVWTVLRSLVCAFGLLSLAYWGYLSWPYPFPAVFFIVGAPLFAAVVWYLFRSPRSPIETDVVGKTVVETALVVAAGATWISLGHPVVGLVFVVVAAVSGVVAFRRETA